MFLTMLEELKANVQPRSLDIPYKCYVLLLPSSLTVLSSIGVIKLITRRGLPRTELNDHTNLYSNIIIMCECTYKTNWTTLSMK